MSNRLLGRTLYVLADHGLSCGCCLAQALKAALDVSKDDVDSYGPKKVAAWIAAKLVSAQYDDSDIQQARGVNFVCAIHSFSLFEALRKLAGMNGNQLLTVTQDQLKKNYTLEVAKAEFLVDAVQGLSDSSATLACTSHASFGVPVLRSVSRQLACFMAARALKGSDLSEHHAKGDVCLLQPRKQSMGVRLSFEQHSWMRLRPKSAEARKHNWWTGHCRGQYAGWEAQYPRFLWGEWER